MAADRSETRQEWRAERFYQKHNERIPDRWCWGIEDDAGIFAILPEDDEAECRANAMLIASVPQLLDALTTIRNMAGAAFTSGGTFGDIVSIESVARHALREAHDVQISGGPQS